MNSSENFNQDGISTDSERPTAKGEAIEANDAPKAVAEPAASGADAEIKSKGSPAVAVQGPAPVVAAVEAKSETGASDEAKSPAPKIPSPTAAAKEASERSTGGFSLIPFTPGQRADAGPKSAASAWRAVKEKRVQLGAIAAGVALIGGVAVASVSYKAQQDQYLVSRDNETQELTETVKSLKARLSAIDTSKHEDITELRKSVAELKNSLAAAHDSSATVAQLNARAERLEHDEASRREEIADMRKSVAELKTGLAANHDASAALAQFTARADRLDHDAATHNADFSTRLEKLEKKAAAPAVASIAPTPAPASVPVPLPTTTSAALTKQPTVLPAATNVSKETTGAIAPQAPIHGWAVREVRGNVAIVEGPYGYRQIGPGDTLPGAGHVERIEKRATGWTVVTDRGIIASAYSGSYRGGGYGGYRYGAYNDSYGPAGGEF
jgi:uncharacterized phage infection (PIP) family protein YhgE